MVLPLSATPGGPVPAFASVEGSVVLPAPSLSTKSPVLTFALNLTFNEKQLLASAIVLEPPLPAVRSVGFYFYVCNWKIPWWD